MVQAVSCLGRLPTPELVGWMLGLRHWCDDDTSAGMSLTQLPIYDPHLSKALDTLRPQTGGRYCQQQNATSGSSDKSFS